MSYIKKINTLFWFLKRPKFIPQIFQVLKRSKNEELENTREESTKWCKNIAIEPENVFDILGVKIDYISLEELFPEVIYEAKQKEKNATVKMGGEGAISFLYHLIKHFRLKIIIESGVAYGWSTLSILLAINDEVDGKLISNDMPYVKMNNEDFVGCIIPDSLRSKWDLQRLPDLIGLPRAFNKVSEKVDLFHYDSDKSYTGRMWAYPIIWRNLNEDGFFVSDDINDNLAFKHFTEEVNRKPIVIEHLGKYVGIIRK